MVSNSGGGFSRYNEFDLTRWRADATRDEWGSFIYIRDVRSANVWATTYQPIGGAQEPFRPALPSTGLNSNAARSVSKH